MPLLDRYVLKKFCFPFFYSLIGFISIWLIWDISSNAPNFMQEGWDFWQLTHFYLIQLPSVILLSAPVALLLALLYGFYQMSRHYEVIAMLSSGRSLYRIFLPLLWVTLFLVGFLTLLNYEYAPQAEARRDAMKEEVKTGYLQSDKIYFHLFCNRRDHRIWYTQLLDGTGAEQVEVIQQDTAGNIIEKWYANEAIFDSTTKSWDFEDVAHVTLKSSGKVDKIIFLDHITMRGWSETPWRLASSKLKPDQLGVPQLREYLRVNSDFPPNKLYPFFTQLHYRWALPWSCLAILLFAAPLGVVLSRQGMMGGVVNAMVLFTALLFLQNFFLALGKGGLLPSWLAAWGPVMLVASVGGVILWSKDSGRSWKRLFSFLFLFF
jgi:lipopolysaccharide export system permease protein